MISRQNGARDLAEILSEYQPGCSPQVVNPRAEEVLYVASGRGKCHIGGFDYELEAGVGCYVPPATPYTVECAGPEPMVVVSVCCPQEERREIIHETVPIARPEGAPPRRVVREQERPPIPVADRQFKWMANEELGCQQITQFIGFIPPSKAPFHYHTYEEAIFILEGRGIVHVEGASQEFVAGSSIYLPPGLRHCLENPGPAAVRLLGAFYPSGSPAVAYES